MRTDGKRVKNASPEYLVGGQLMKKRNDALNMTEVDILLDPISAYVRQKRSDGIRISHLGVFLAAYVRTVAEFPLLNRFFVGGCPYARKELAVSMVVLKPGGDDGTTSKMFFELEDDIFAVQKTLDTFINGNRQEGDTNGTDVVARLLVKVPGLLSIGATILRMLDRLGWMPKSLIDVSPFHASLLVSNLASIGTGHIYHHVYNFGTTGIAITLGKPRETAVRHGSAVRFERCLPLGVAMDERICNGSYFAMAFARMKEYLSTPTLLEGPSPNPIIREWARPGEYEAIKAKRDYKAACRKIASSDMSRAEKKSAKKEQKRLKKAALRAAKALKKAAKREAKA